MKITTSMRLIKMAVIRRDLTPFEDVKTVIIDELDEIESDILIGINKRNREVFDVLRLNIITGDMKLAAENPGKYLSLVHRPRRKNKSSSYNRWR